MDDVHAASRLLHWGLRARDRPAQHPEYRDLIDRYIDHPSFRDLVRQIAAGLGLCVLDANKHGIVLGPEPESPFALRPADFRRSSSTSADQRLLDGLVQVAIAARVFPKARDLEEDATLARQPVTVGEIEDMLRSLCSKFEEGAKGQPDPAASEELAGLYEAWRVYHGRAATKETSGRRRALGTTHRLIERGLDRLCEFGCFMREESRDGPKYQPTWRYQVLVKELASVQVYDHVRSILDRPEGKPEGGR